MIEPAVWLDIGLYYMYTFLGKGSNEDYDWACSVARHWCILQPFKQELVVAWMKTNIKPAVWLDIGLSYTILGKGLNEDYDRACSVWVWLDLSLTVHDVHVHQLNHLASLQCELSLECIGHLIPRVGINQSSLCFSSSLNSQECKDIIIVRGWR